MPPWGGSGHVLLGVDPGEDLSHAVGTMSPSSSSGTKKSGYLCSECSLYNLTSGKAEENGRMRGVLTLNKDTIKQKQIWLSSSL